MEPLVVWADQNRIERGAHHSFSLDLAYGSSVNISNDFELTLSDDIRLSAGYYIHVEDTGWGGVVDGCKSVTSQPGALSWVGRTWQGMLKHKVICPDSGSSHYTASGSVSACITALIERIGLDGIFAVGECESATVSYQYARYCTAWDGLLAMLESVDMRPTFSTSVTSGVLTVLIGAVSNTALIDAIDSDLLDFEATAAWRATNHLICLGSGELTDRLVVHLYADANGTISQTQTYTGPDEVCAVYETSATGTTAALVEDGTKQLKKMLDASEVSASVDKSIEADVGDIVRAFDARVNLSATATISEVVVQIENGIVTVTRKSGDPMVSTDMT